MEICGFPAHYLLKLYLFDDGEGLLLDGRLNSPFLDAEILSTSNLDNTSWNGSI
jgi:hypothetical protein